MTTSYKLNDKVIVTSVINAEYVGRIDDYKNIPSDFNLEYLKNKYNEPEKWRNYLNLDNSKLQISNYGRVRNSETDEYYNYSDKYKLGGYLYLKDWKSIETDDFKFKDDYIYQMVAKTWLKTREKCSMCKERHCELEIHHITNDGYDNSVWNLVYLIKCEHSKINHRTKEWKMNITC